MFTRTSKALNSFFRLQENHTTIRTEIGAGITSFLAMAYILAVNPSILGAAGMDRGGVLFATAIASFFGTTLMAVMANYPFCLAPVMGLNAYFAFTVVRAFGYSWQFALFAVFCEGLIFLMLSVSNIREMMFDAIPMPLKKATGVGIGLFISFIAFQNAHIVKDNSATLVMLQDFSRENIHTHGISAILACVGIVITAILLQRKIRSGILLGILITWVLGILAQLTGLYQVNPEAGCYSLIPQMTFNSFSAAFDGFCNLFGSAFRASEWTKAGVEGNGLTLLFSMNFVMIVVAFLFVDLFSTLGTMTGVALKANLLDANGRLPRIKQAFIADSFTTSMGAVFGTSTTSSYVESAAGVMAGGRTGLTALTTAILFLLSLLFAPLLLAIPPFATAPALIIVGFYMMTPITSINFNDMGEAVPAFLTIIIMPFAYSITDGICFGIISWTILNLCQGRRERNTPLMYILAVLFLIKYILI